MLVPWIADPLTHFFHHEHEHHKIDTATEKTGDTEVHEEEAAAAQHQADRESIQEMIETEEAEPLELFYDLFFVANLTTVTAVHYVVDTNCGCPGCVAAASLTGQRCTRTSCSSSSCGSRGCRRLGW